MTKYVLPSGNFLHIENHHFEEQNSRTFDLAILHSYVQLQEGLSKPKGQWKFTQGEWNQEFSGSGSKKRFEPKREHHQVWTFYLHHLMIFNGTIRDDVFFGCTTLFEDTVL